MQNKFYLYLDRRLPLAMNQSKIYFCIIKTPINNKNTGKENIMKIELLQLPYGKEDLQPVISKETLEFHHGKHLAGYVTTLGSLVKDTPMQDKTVEEIIKEAPEGPVFNNAGQIYNHTYYFAQFRKAQVDNCPQGAVAELIDSHFGGFDAFKEQFTQAGVALFGSGWVWLSLDAEGKPVISKESNAGNPVKKGHKPLLVLDVWEHSYYIDYQNRRADHLKEVWSIIDWNVINDRLK